MATLGFTPASQQDVFSIETEPARCKPASVLCGEEARRFYENITQGDTKQPASSVRKLSGRQRRSACSRRVRAETRRGQRDAVVQGGASGQGAASERLKEYQGLRLLRCAHEGDTSGVKELLTKSVDINFQVQ